MDRFVSNYTLRLDAKGRVSIPAPYRAVLARDGFDGLYCYPTLDQTAIDAGGNALLAEIEALIARFAPYSEEREQFAAALYGTSEVLKVDGEGRVILTDELKSHANITGAVTFVGLGTNFRSGNLPLSRASRTGHGDARAARRSQKWGQIPRGTGMMAGAAPGNRAPLADRLVTFPCSFLVLNSSTHATAA